MRLPPAPAGYELVRELGSGGMGTVYLAWEVALEREVAMKFLQRPGNHGAFERFLVEVRALALLDHPHIVSVLSSDFLRSDPFFTTEYVPGGSLSKKVEANGPLDPMDAALLMAIAARAIHAANAANVIHRDLKPSNILLAADGTPRIADFGLAKRLDRDDQLTTATGPLGTPRYMAPEQTGRKEGVIDARTDVYGLGATLYYLITGQPPFTDPPDESIKQIQNEPPRPPRAIRHVIPRELEAIVLKCLEKEPDRRYPSAEELAADLDRFIAGQVPVAPLLTWPRRLRQRVRRHRKQIAAIGSATLIMVVVFMLGAAIWPRPKSATPPDPADEIRKELAAGRPVTLVHTTGLPKYQRILLEPNAVGESSLGDKTCSIIGFGYCLLELCPNPGCDRYRIDLEIRQVRANMSRPDGPDTDAAGVYLGYASGPAAEGATAHSMFGITFKDYMPTGRPPKVPLTSSVSLRTMGWVQRPDKLVEDNPSRLAAVAFTPTPTRPGPWRAMSIHVNPAGFQVIWKETGGKDIPLVLPPNATAVSAYGALKGRLDTIAPGALGLPNWSPQMPLGVFSYRSEVSVRNVIITPLPTAQ